MINIFVQMLKLYKYLTLTGFTMLLFQVDHVRRVLCLRGRPGHESYFESQPRLSSITEFHKFTQGLEPSVSYTPCLHKRELADTCIPKPHTDWQPSDSRTLMLLMLTKKRTGPLLLVRATRSIL